MVFAIILAYFQFLHYFIYSQIQHFLIKKNDKNPIVVAFLNRNLQHVKFVMDITVKFLRLFYNLHQIKIWTFL